LGGLTGIFDLEGEQAQDVWGVAMRLPVAALRF